MPRRGTPSWQARPPAPCFGFQARGFSNGIASPRPRIRTVEIISNTHFSLDNRVPVCYPALCLSSSIPNLASGEGCESCKGRVEGSLFTPPRAAGLIALRTDVHKTPSTTPLFSQSCKRVCISLKTRSFNSLSFHTHAHSFAVSPLFATHTQNILGVYVPPMLQSLFPDELVNSNPLLSSTSVLVRNRKTQSVQLFCFQSILRSFALFSCKSFVYLTYAKQPGGVYPKVSDSGIFAFPHANRLRRLAYQPFSRLRHPDLRVVKWFPITQLIKS